MHILFCIFTSIFLYLLVPIKTDISSIPICNLGYSLSGLSGMQPAIHEVVNEMFEELCLKVAKSEFKGQPNLLFLQFGKGVRVQKGNNQLTLNSAESLVDGKLRGDRVVRLLD